MQITLNARYFALAHNFKSTEETRYSLCGVFVEPAEGGGAYITAADAHRLGTFYDAGAVGVPPAGILLNVAGAADLTKLRKSEEPVVITRADDETVLCETLRDSTGRGAHRCFANIIDGQFPDWRRIIPSLPTGPASPKHTAVNVNGGLLQAFAFKKDDFITVRFSEGGEKSPLIVTVSEYPDFFGVLMPVSMASETEHPLFKRAEAAKQAA